MNEPRVSVIMNCLNGEKYLREAIESVYAQSYKNWEIIFWDNASTDKSAEIAKSFDEKIRYFRSDETYCVGKVRNLALAQATGEFIAFLDCDDIWHPEKLEKQIPCFENNPEVALVFCDAIYFNDRGVICQIYKKFKPPRGIIFRELFRKYFLCIVSVMIRRSAIQNMKWFDERVDFFEDAGLFLRIAYSNPLDYVDEPLVRYRVRRDSGTFKDYNLLASEKELFLNDCSQEFPDFEKNYAEEIRIFKDQVALQKGLGAWLTAQPEEARKIFRQIRPRRLLVYCLVVLTFFPPTFFYLLLNLNYRLKNRFNWYRF
jgi:glycosyltransferase involved in cell wall biosynthesis